jgi:hypothetical protein
VQTLHQQDGFAITLLALDRDETADETPLTISRRVRC